MIKAIRTIKQASRIWDSTGALILILALHLSFVRKMKKGRNKDSVFLPTSSLLLGTPT